MKTLQREWVLFLGQVDRADTDQDVRAIEVVGSLLVELATLLVSSEREIVLSLYVTHVAGVAQHARHADLVAVRLKFRQALLEILDCLNVVSLQRSHESDASQCRCNGRIRRRLLSDRKTLHVAFECGGVIAAHAMDVTDALETSSDTGRIVERSFNREAPVVKLQRAIVIALVVITIGGAAIARNHSSAAVLRSEKLERSQVIYQCLAVVMLHVKRFSNSRQTLASRAPFRNLEKRLARSVVIAHLVLQTADAGERVCNLRGVAGGFKLFECFFKCLERFGWFSL